MNAPAHWRRVSLLDVCTLNPRPRLSADVKVDYVDYSNIDDATGVITSSRDRASGEVPRGASTFRNGDVLFAGVTAEHWKSALVSDLKHEYGKGPNLTVLRPGPELSAAYLWHFFQQPWIRQQASRMNTSTLSQPILPHSFFKNIRITLPPFDEQLYIVDALEQASIVPYRHALQRVQQLKGELAAHLMLPQRSFEPGWSLFKIDDICQINPAEHLSGAPAPSLDDEVVYFPGQDLLTNELAATSVRYRDIPLPIRPVQAGDLLVGAYTDKTGYGGAVVVPESDTPQFVARALTVLRPEPTVSSHYLAELLQSTWFNNHVQRQATPSHRSANETSMLARLKLTLPNRYKQKHIVDVLCQVPVQEVKNTVAKARSIYHALARDAFDGQWSKRWRPAGNSNSAAALHTIDDRTQIIAVAPLAVMPFKRGNRAGAIVSLSRFQRLVWRALRKNNQALIVDDPESFEMFCTSRSLAPLREFVSHNQVRRTLEQIASLGLIQKMSLPPRGKGDAKPYLLAFRAFRQEVSARIDEDTKLTDAQMLRASILEEEIGL
ncbi:hypothetical protein DXV65_15010 [Pseudomonas fluorescens]|nr:hypothetical protein DXV65_15010 [Pseudomonas fluorescens]QTV17085.1 hypothetical protein J9321_28945 [Pseudomonas fluorescens]